MAEGVQVAQHSAEEGAEHGAEPAAEHGAEHSGGHGGSTPHNPSIMAKIVSPMFGGEVHAVPPYAEAIGVSIAVAIGLVAVSAAFTKSMDSWRRRPTRAQAAFEKIIEALDGFIHQLIGHNHRRYVPLVGTLFLYIFFLNLAGIFPGLMSPTSSASVTLGLALVVFLYVQFEGIRANGIGGYLRHFAGEPVWLAPLNFPLHLIGNLARPMSLTLRLFGNIFGEDLAIVILMSLGLVFFPIQFFVSVLAVFTSFVQAMVFSMLTCVYLAEATVHQDAAHGEHADHGHGVVETLTPAAPA